MRLIDYAKNKKVGVVSKYRHYFEAYDLHFLKMRKRPIKLLEIGIQNGGSLNMWKDYFQKGEIYGIDIDKKCLKYESDRIKVFIGNQIDNEFLQDFINRAGEFNIIIDDGSHQVSHQIFTFKALFPYVREGGYYIIEDLHTSYWPAFGGKNGFHDSCIEFLKKRIDGLNYWAPRHKRAEGARIKSAINNIDLKICSLSFYDSICFILKGDHLLPERYTV